MVGHATVAAGAIEAVATAMTLMHQVLHPTINQEVADAACDLDYVPNGPARSGRRRAVQLVRVRRAERHAHPPPSSRVMPRVWSVAVALLARVYRIYYATLRVRLLMPDSSSVPLRSYQSGREVFALCERDALALAGAMAGRRLTVLVAHGRDGDWATMALKTIGTHVVRGSSRRGALTATRELLRHLTGSDGAAAVVVDGPLGPAGEPKAGVVFCAWRMGRRVTPLGVAASHEVVFKGSWSHLYLPLPFSRVVIVLGEPMAPDSHGRVAAVNELTERLVSARKRALDIVGSRVGHGSSDVVVGGRTP